uniref:Uncharacterized protein n=1 Tax=Oryza sativa subsp. japonica TaxID=39947 RepID=Q6UUM6_ORYSJ|nr:hypothetical protein OSJNBa0095C12.19 [Oryza sativa Japonica Group]
MDLDKSTSTSASLKKLQEDGTLPGRRTAEREVGGLDSATVKRRVGQLMISGPTTASNVPVPLSEKGAAERDAAINASDASPPPPRRQRLVTLDENASPAVASTDVVVVPRSREVTPSGPAGDPSAGRGPSTAVLTWEELQVEMGCLLEAGARGVSHEIAEARAAAASSANERTDRLARDLAEVREDLQKMRELVAGNERQWQGFEHRMSELENNLSEIRGSFRVTNTGLHQLTGECDIKSTIPVNPD